MRRELFGATVFRMVSITFAKSRKVASTGLVTGNKRTLVKLQVTGAPFLRVTNKCRIAIKDTVARRTVLGSVTGFTRLKYLQCTPCVLRVHSLSLSGAYKHT